MKKLILLLSSLALLTFLAGCGQSGSPSQTAENFFQALSEKDLDTARELLKPEYHGFLGMMEMASEEDLAEMSGVRAVNEEIYEEDGRTFATVTLSHPEEDEDEELTLELVDDVWLVDLGDVK
ncbi:MAG: DUF4878 domain-containing protein [Opitutales bacterium]|nr:DUF4878 domain-containing protein [Opitutales bacterium]MCH8540904.1 DUF4878 domain-containing protein [Opitutales bacterium]